jgi:heme/copper-type cytochrome/quinol oxidase subunit 4
MSKTFEDFTTTNISNKSPIISNGKKTSNPLLSRKFLFSLLLTFLSFVLVLIGKLTPKEWIDFVMIVAGIYATSNVATKFVKE